LFLASSPHTLQSLKYTPDISVGHAQTLGLIFISVYAFDLTGRWIERDIVLEKVAVEETARVCWVAESE
jgi:hypothetical protein